MTQSSAIRRLSLSGRLKHWGGWLLRDRWMMLEGRRDLLAVEIARLTGRGSAGRRPSARPAEAGLP